MLKSIDVEPSKELNEMLEEKIVELVSLLKTAGVDGNDVIEITVRKDGYYSYYIHKLVER